MNFKQIQQLIKFVARTGVSEVNIENSNIKINIKGNTKGENSQVVQQPVISQIQPVQAVESVQSPPNPTPIANDNSVVTANDESNLITIKSPIIGTFYRKPSPDKDNFVENLLDNKNIFNLNKYQKSSLVKNIDDNIRLIKKITFSNFIKNF